MEILYVTSLGLESAGGNGMRNRFAWEALSSRFSANYYGPVAPPVSRSALLKASALRRCGLASGYPYYSKARLTGFRREVEIGLGMAPPRVFFNGFTQWTGLDVGVPYAAWNDCIFPDYVDIFNAGLRFRSHDIARIENGESRWLRHAQAVGFRSRFFADRAIARYSLDPSRIFVVPNFGSGEPSEDDIYVSGRRILFVSTDFFAKGGHLLLEACAVLKARYPDLKVDVVGDCPPILERYPFAHGHGFLRRDNPTENGILSGLFSAAFLLVHPTVKDTNPAILVEAMHFGVPVVAPRGFAIPEFVADGEHGFLIDARPTVESVIAAMEKVLLMESPHYLAMRQAALIQGRRFSKVAAREAFLKALTDIDW